MGDASVALVSEHLSSRRVCDDDKAVAPDDMVRPRRQEASMQEEKDPNQAPRILRASALEILDGAFARSDGCK